MKERIHLKPNTELRFQNHAKGMMHFVVTDVLGEGGSCIVYNGYYLNNTNTKTTVRIKECYPYKLHLERDEDNFLLVSEGEEKLFLEYKERVVRSFEVANELHESSGLNNFTSNMYDIYEANNTVYIVSSYVEGNTVAEVHIDSLASAVRVALSVAKCIYKIHKRGYLYLDIKPDNIFLFEATYDIIQLFDFDSVIPIGCKEAITNYKLSYSMGFAPLEQKKGIMAQIGPHTDVYSLGALLFYMLFGKAPKPLDCGMTAEYDFDKLVFGSSHQNKVYKELTSFFRKTLQAYSLDRYQDMASAVEQLEVILRYVDLPVPFICSTYVSNIGTVVGRNEECSILKEWIRSDEEVIFVTGMGGIGKSTIVRKFVGENRDEWDHVIYLKYKNTICDTIADDMQFCISGYERDEEESAKDYFVRKLKAAKELSNGSSTLLIVDNFDGRLDVDFESLLRLRWKIIFVTRSVMSGINYPCMKVERFRDNEDLKTLFENNLGKRLDQIDGRRFNRIVEKVCGHTLVLVLIAKQISKSYLSFEEAYNLVESNGFAEIAPEMVDYEHDGNRFHDKISGIIMAICNTSALSDAEKKCLKITSMFAGVGIGIKEAKELIWLKSLDDINNLKELGWIEIAENEIQMHPLIQETVYHLEWTEECRVIAISKMEELFKQIKLNGKQEDYPKKLYERNKKIKQNMEQAEITDKIITKMLAKKGIVGEVALERIMYSDGCALDTKSFYHLLDISKSVIAACVWDKNLCDEKIYKDLLYVTLINLPKDQEDYVIYKADTLFGDESCRNPYALMELYDYVVYLLCQKEDYESARKYLDAAKSFATGWRDHYVWGLFYDMQNDFYEALLDGAYCSQDEDDESILRLLEESVEQSIKHMKKSRHESAKLYYAKFVLGKASLLIRVRPEKDRYIKKLIDMVIPIIAVNALEYAEVRAVFHMVCAWYYALCELNEEKMILHLGKAKEIDAHRKISELDKIDYYYIPAANIMCEIERNDYSIFFLKEAYAICDTHKDSLPYIRKKLDLLSYQLEVFYCEENFDGCREILRQIDKVNNESIEYGIVLEISEDMRKEVFG